MPKQYTLSESDRRLLGASLREQRSAPPRPAIVRIQGKEFESADSWWALPPCETGLPAAWLSDDGNLFWGGAICCIYKLNTSSGSLEPVKDGYGRVLRHHVFNAYPYTINTIVRIHQDKNGVWSNEAVAIEPAVSSTSSTTDNPNTTPTPSLCAGECVWIATTDNNGNVIWRPQPQGGCRDTTTPEPGTTPQPPQTTAAPTTTPAPCQTEKCRLICLATTTASPGTTVWPPSPAIPYRYQQVINQTYPGCSQPCTCYGVGDPCWLLNGEVESRCLVVSTTTSTTTTTSGPLPNQVCDWLVGQQGGQPFSPGTFVAGAWSDFRNGGWQICNACEEGKEPWIIPQQPYDDGESSVADYRFYDILGQNNPGLPWSPAQGAWRFDVGCRKSVCSVGGPIQATENQAEYRAFTREDIYRYWLDDACNVFGVDFLRKVFIRAGVLGEENATTPLCGDAFAGLADFYKDVLFNAVFGSEHPLIAALQARQMPALHRAMWSVCKTCPPGTRPQTPPKPVIFSTDAFSDENSGTIENGVWVYRTECVPGINCGECEEIPVFLNPGSPSPTTSGTPTSTTTLAPCGCEPPKFCPTVVNECARTRCVPGGSNVPPPCTTSSPGTCYDVVYQKMCDCNTTTTGRPTTSSTTTASPSCLSDTCEWVLTHSYSLGSYGGGSGLDCTRPGNAPPPLQWVQRKYCGAVASSGSILGSVACQCSAAPPTTCVPCTLTSGASGTFCQGVGSCGDVFTASCIVSVTSTTCAPPANCPNCENGCYWGSEWTGTGYSWKKLTHSRSEIGASVRWPETGPKDIVYPSGCADPSITNNLITGNGYSFNPDGSQSCPSANSSQVVSEIPIGCGTGCEANLRNRNFLCGPGGRRYPCACKPPAYPPSGCDWMVFTPCEELRPKECACCSTTTTTENPCSRHCIYKGDGSGGWTQISNPCSGGCPCPSPLGQSHDSCEKIELKCGSRPSTTTTTTTGTGAPTTTTTTTARPQGACCYSGYNPSGCVNTWQIECTSAGGTWLGAGTNCSTSSCPVTTTVAPTTSTTTTTAGPTTTTTTTTTTAAPLGRCCSGTGQWGVGCEITTEAQCNAVLGNWVNGQTCVSMPCVGACCYETALSGIICNDFVTQSNCNSLAGTWYPGSSCSTLNNCQGGVTTTSGPTTGTPTLAP